MLKKSNIIFHLPQRLLHSTHQTDEQKKNEISNSHEIFNDEKSVYLNWHLWIRIYFFQMYSLFFHLVNIHEAYGPAAMHLHLYPYSRHFPIYFDLKFEFHIVFNRMFCWWFSLFFIYAIRFARNNDNKLCYQCWARKSGGNVAYK